MNLFGCRIYFRMLIKGESVDDIIMMKHQLHNIYGIINLHHRLERRTLGQSHRRSDSKFPQSE